MRGEDKCLAFPRAITVKAYIDAKTKWLKALARDPKSDETQECREEMHDAAMGVAEEVCQ